jgi:F-type H+-transporting ATPase subunit b
MSALSTALVGVAEIVVREGGHHAPFDDQGYHTENPILPPTGELLIGAAASLIVFGLLIKYMGPTIRQFFRDRTSRVQAELENSAAAKAAAEAEAEQIRAAKGDIDAERSRLYAEADAQAEALLTEGRARIEAEMAELERRADAEIEAAAGRSSEELAAEIASYSSRAIERVVTETLDDAAQQDLIENFIARVGASR